MALLFLLPFLGVEYFFEEGFLLSSSYNSISNLFKNRKYVEATFLLCSSSIKIILIKT